MEQKYIELRKTRDFGSKLNATFEFIKLNLKPLFTAVIYIAGPGILLSSAAYILYIDDISNIFTNIQTDAARFNFEFVYNLGAFLVLFFIAYTLLILTVLNYLNLYDEKKSSDISVEEVWDRVKGKFLTMTISYILLIVIIFIAFMLVAVLFTALAGSLFFSILAGILLFGAFFYLIFTLTLFNNVLINENKGIADFVSIIQRCFYLIRGKFWSTFGIILISGIVVSLIGGILGAPVTFSQFLTLLSDGGEESMGIYSQWQMVYMGIVQGVQQLLQVITVVAISFQYFNLVERKEASGLVNMISGLETKASSDMPKKSDDSEDDEHY